MWVYNYTNINKTNNYLWSQITERTHTRTYTPRHMALNIQTLPWDRHKCLTVCSSLCLENALFRTKEVISTFQQHLYIWSRYLSVDTIFQSLFVVSIIQDFCDIVLLRAEKLLNQWFLMKTNNDEITTSEVLRLPSSGEPLRFLITPLVYSNFTCQISYFKQ